MSFFIVFFQLLKDSQFKEFLEINKDRRSKPVWAEDVVDLPEAGSDKDAASSSDSDYESNFEKIGKSEFNHLCKQFHLQN